MNSTLLEIQAEISKALLRNASPPKSWSKTTLAVETSDAALKKKVWWVRTDLGASLLSASQVQALVASKVVLFKSKQKDLGRTSAKCLVIDASALEKKVANATRSSLQMESKAKALLHQNVSLKSQVLEQSEQEALIANLIQAVNAKVFKSPRASSLRPSPKNKVLGGVPTLFLSDWHVGEQVDPDQIEGANQYNMEIAKERASHTFNRAKTELFTNLSGFRYDGIVIAFGGDMVSGNIHEELTRTNQKAVPECMVYTAEIIAQEIVQMADCFEEVYVPCVGGNHGRLDVKTVAKQAALNNLDYMLYLMIESLVKGMLGSANNVVFNISKSLDTQYSVYGVRYLLTHGDQFRESTNSSTFWPNLIEAARKKNERSRSMGNDTFDYMLCGHFHKYGAVGNVIVNGSLKGYDEWVYKQNFSLEAPTQALWITHPHDRFLRHIPIFAEEPVDDAAAYGAPISDLKVKGKFCG